MRRLFFVFMLLILLASGVSAQDDPNEGTVCDFSDSTDRFGNELLEASTFADVQRTRLALAGWLALCDDERFFYGSGADVIGPIQLRRGVYIITYTATPSRSSGTFDLEVENLTTDEYIDGVFEQPRGETIRGRELIRVDGGNYLFSVETTNLSEWSFEISQP